MDVINSNVKLFDSPDKSNGRVRHPIIGLYLNPIATHIEMTVDTPMDANAALSADERYSSGNASDRLATKAQDDRNRKIHMSALGDSMESDEMQKGWSC